AGADQPPDAVQAKAAQGHLADLDMAIVRGVEGAAQQADPLAGRGDWQACPVVHRGRPTQLPAAGDAACPLSGGTAPAVGASAGSAASAVPSSAPSSAGACRGGNATRPAPSPI